MPQSPPRPTTSVSVPVVRRPAKIWMRVLRIAVPVLLLGVIYWAVFLQHGIFDFGGPKRVVLTPDQARQLEDQSRSLIRTDKYAAALDPTQTLHDAFPANHIYIGRLADIYDHLGRYADEAAMWELYLDHAPTPVEACPKIGDAYWKQGEGHEKQAIDAYQRCLNLDPKNTDSIFFLAHALEMNGDWGRAAQLYQQGLALAPNYTDLRIGYGRSLLHLDKADDAKQEVQQVLDKNPANLDALLAMGMIDLRLDKIDEAKQYLQRGVKLADDDPDFHLLLARAAELQNDDAELLRQYNRLVELRPTDQRIRARRDAMLAPQKK